MKITFEGKTIGEVLDQMQDLLNGLKGPGPEAPAARPTRIEVEPVNNPLTIDALPVDKPVEKPKPGRTEKQKANDEKLRERALAKKAAGLKVGDKAPKAAPVEKPLPPPPATAKSLGLDPAEVVNIRQKTINDLQEAYANGKQQEVFDLLSRFGNGAKSFRELSPESFVPIREAIDLGALT